MIPINKRFHLHQSMRIQYAKMTKIAILIVRVKELQKIGKFNINYCHK